MLRTVADVGFVGLPNAGKSTLLGALSRASPEIAPFPFTTLMPNLGAMAAAPAPPAQTPADGAAEAARATPTGPMVLADLPGLVEGAHQGRGLGRLFLRHLRRVRVVLYVLDTSRDSPSVGEQYSTLRRELELYNPQYLLRPHLVALNKLDLPLEVGGESAMAEVRRAAMRQVAECAASGTEQTPPPIAVVPISGLRGKGMRILKESLQKALDAVASEEQGPPASPS